MDGMFVTFYVDDLTLSRMKLGPNQSASYRASCIINDAVNSIKAVARSYRFIGKTNDGDVGFWRSIDDASLLFSWADMCRAFDLSGSSERARRMEGVHFVNLRANNKGRPTRACGAYVITCAIESARKYDDVTPLLRRLQSIEAEAQAIASRYQ